MTNNEVIVAVQRCQDRQEDNDISQQMRHDLRISMEGRQELCSDRRPILTPSLQFPSLALLTATLVNSTWHKQSRGLRVRDERFIVCLRAVLSFCSNTSPGSHIWLAVTYCTSLKQENTL